MSSVIIWHNPRCTKSRETLALMREHGHEPDDIRLYLDQAPDDAELREALKLLGISAGQLLRGKEKLAKELGVNKNDPEETLIKAMVENPRLIERPIVFANGKAALGRPPEDVLAIL